MTSIANDYFEAAGTMKIAKVLQNISSLTELYINDNQITGETGNDIVDLIQQNGNLKILNLSNNDIGRVKIAKTLRHDISFAKYSINNEELILKKKTQVYLIAAILRCF